MADFKSILAMLGKKQEEPTVENTIPQLGQGTGQEMPYPEYSDMPSVEHLGMPMNYKERDEMEKQANDVAQGMGSIGGVAKVGAPLAQGGIKAAMEALRNSGRAISNDAPKFVPGSLGKVNIQFPDIMKKVRGK